MARTFRMLSLNESNYMHYDFIGIDPAARNCSGEICFLSVVAHDTLMKNIYKLINQPKIKVANIMHVGNFNICGDFNLEKVTKDDFTHLVAIRKDIVEQIEIRTQDNEVKKINEYTFYVLYRNNNEFLNILYDKIYENTSIPIKEEWMEFIVDRLTSRECIRNLRILDSYERTDDRPYNIKKIIFNDQDFESIVVLGLRRNRITMNSSSVSSVIEDTKGLDSYLSTYGDKLSEKIQSSFVPKFDPTVEEPIYSESVYNYDDMLYHTTGKKLLNAQRATVQSVVNNWNKNKVTILVGEMGVGKTTLGAGSTYSHFGRKSGLTSIITCPGTLLKVWEREITECIPNAKTYIVSCLSDLLALDDVIRDKYKLENTYIIMSKDIMKSEYTKRPCAIWSYSKRTFVCPECGKILYKMVTKTNEKGKKVRVKEYLGPEDFIKQYVYNIKCPNETEKGACGCNLWTALNKNEKTDWVKFGKDGWMLKKHIISTLEKYEEKVQRGIRLVKKEADFYSKLVLAKNDMDNDKEVSLGATAPRKINLAKYIRKNYKGTIDYLIIDELKVWLLTQ